MAKVYKAGVVIGGDASGAVAAANQAGQSIGKLDGIAAKAGAALLGYFSFRAFVEFSTKSIVEYQKQETAVNKLQAALRAAGEKGYKETTQRAIEFASQIQKITTVGDETTLGLMAQAKALGINSGQLELAAKGAIGLAEILDTDVESALRYSAMALQGETTILKRYIPELRSAKDKSEEMAIVQRKMAEGFSIAQEKINTSLGAWQQFQNLVGDTVFEQFGKSLSEAIAPALRDISQTLSDKNFIAGVDATAKLFGMTVGRFAQGVEGSVMAVGAFASAIKEIYAEYKKLEKTGFGIYKHEPQYQFRTKSLESGAGLKYDLTQDAKVPALEFPSLPDEESLAKQAEADKKFLDMKNKAMADYANALQAGYDELDTIATDREANLLKLKTDNANEFLNLEASSNQALADLWSQRGAAYGSLFSSMTTMGQAWQSKEMQLLASVGTQIMSLAQLYTMLGAAKELSSGLKGIVFGAAVLAAGASLISQFSKPAQDLNAGTANISAGSLTAPQTVNNTAQTQNISVNVYGSVLDSRNAIKRFLRNELGPAMKEDSLSYA